jgi:hypothetical protein
MTGFKDISCDAMSSSMLVYGQHLNLSWSTSRMITEDDGLACSHHAIEPRKYLLWSVSEPPGFSRWDFVEERQRMNDSEYEDIQWHYK